MGVGRMSGEYNPELASNPHIVIRTIIKIAPLIIDFNILLTPN